MTVRFAANLTMLWPELDIYERFTAAARAGFSYVEILFPHLLDPDRVEHLLRLNGLELVLFDPAPGDRDAGELGLMTLPGREEEFLMSVRDAVALAHRLGTRRLNVLTGLVPPEIGWDRARTTAILNLGRVAASAADAGITLLIENVNSVEWPGYLTDTVDAAVDLIEATNQPNLRLQFDAYHVAMMGGDPRSEFRRHRSHIGHVQIADAPGRHEPGTGTAHIREFLRELEHAGYDRFVGLEYVPLAGTDQGLSWMHGR